MSVPANVINASGALALYFNSQKPACAPVPVVATFQKAWNAWTGRPNHTTLRTDGVYDAGTQQALGGVEAASLNPSPHFFPQAANCAGNAVTQHTTHGMAARPSGALMTTHKQTSLPVVWRPHDGMAPRGLGALPIRFHGRWLAKRNDGMVMSTGLGATPGSGLLTALSTLVTFLTSNPNPGCTAQAPVQVFQSAYNADPAYGAASGATQLSTDGIYGQTTATAAQQSYSDANVSTPFPTGVTVASGCTSPAPSSAGGSTTTTTSTTSTTSSTPAATATPTNYTPYYIAAGVVAAGGLGYYLIKHGRKR